MTQQHPITPPPELVQQWEEQFEAGRSLFAMFEDIYRAGADAELEACCEWLGQEGWSGESRQLRAARRPKPSSLKEQALEALDEEQAELSIQNYKLIRAVLESLPDHE